MSRTEADDVSQNAILSILGSLHTYKGQTSLERWAASVTARVAIHFARTQRRRHFVEEPHAELPPSATSETPIGVRLELEQVMRTLPEAPREALQLRYILGLSVEEIAELTDVPVNTAKTRLKTGLRLMREGYSQSSEGLG